MCGYKLYVWKLLEVEKTVHIGRRLLGKSCMKFILLRVEQFFIVSRFHKIDRIKRNEVKKTKMQKGGGSGKRKVLQEHRYKPNIEMSMLYL